MDMPDPSNLNVPVIIEAIGLGLSLLQMIYAYSISSSGNMWKKHTQDMNYNNGTNPLFPLKESQIGPLNSILLIEKLLMISSIVTIFIVGFHITVIIKAPRGEGPNRSNIFLYFANFIPLIFSIINFLSASFYTTTIHLDIIQHQMYSHLETKYPNFAIFRACISGMKDAKDLSQNLNLSPVLEEQRKRLSLVGMCPPTLDRNIAATLAEVNGILFMVVFLIIGIDKWRFPFKLLWTKEELNGVEPEMIIREQHQLLNRRAYQAERQRAATAEESLRGNLEGS